MPRATAAALPGDGRHRILCGGDCEIHWLGTLISGGHNIDGDSTCQLSGPGDQPGTDPMLEPLKDNGGSTKTHALLPGSPAIDAGDDAACPTVDQRGHARPQGAACDVGAFEVSRRE